MIAAQVTAATEVAIAALRADLTKAHGEQTAHPLAILIDPTLGNPLDLSGPSVQSDETSSQAKDLLIEAFLLCAHPPDFVQLPIVHQNLPAASRPFLLVIPDEARFERLVNATLRLAVEEALGLCDLDTGGSPRSICAWLTPPPATSQGGEVDVPQWTTRTAAHLARQALVLAPEGVAAVAGKCQLWRFWDPRGASRVWPVLSDKQRETLLGPVHSWFCIQQTGTSLGALVALKVAAQTGRDVFDPPTVLPPVALTATQWQLCERVGPLHSALRHSGEWPVVLSTAATPELVDELLIRAQAHGVSGENDLLLFVHTALTVHPEFDGHPQVLAALRAKRVKDDLTSCFAKVPAALWQQIAAAGAKA